MPSQFRFTVLGVREYVLFDPEAEYLRPRLQGFRLVEGHYELMVPDTDDRLRSDELGLLLRGEGLMLRLLDGTTGAPILTRQERVLEERLRADALAEEVERLKALLEQTRGGSKE